MSVVLNINSVTRLGPELACQPLALLQHGELLSALLEQGLLHAVVNGNRQLRASAR